MKKVNNFEYIVKRRFYKPWQIDKLSIIDKREHINTQLEDSNYIDSILDMIKLDSKLLRLCKKAKNVVLICKSSIDGFFYNIYKDSEIPIKIIDGKLYNIDSIQYKRITTLDKLI